MEITHRHHPAAAYIAMTPDLTFQELGRLVGAHPDVVSRVVRGVQSGSPRLKAAIAAALDLPVDDLFWDDDRAAVSS